MDFQFETKATIVYLIHVKATRLPTPVPPAPVVRNRRQLPRRQSLITQTLEFLKGEIARTVWTKKLPSERKLCEQLVISRGTLRAALDGLERAGLVKRRQGCAWKITDGKKMLRPESSANYFILLAPQPLHLLSLFTIYWIDHLREHLNEAGYHLEIRAERACYTARPDRALEELTRNAAPAGWVLCGTTAPMQHWVAKRRLRCVIVGSRHPGPALVSVDRNHAATCRHAVGTFLAKGCNRLVLLIPNSGLAGDLECEVSFKDAAAKFKRPEVEVIIEHHDGSREHICRRLNVLFQKTSPRTGLLVAGPKFVLTTLGFLARHGLRLSKDVSLISRDDDAFLEFAVPTVARYYSDPMLFARKVSRTVLKLAQDSSASLRDFRLIPRFIPGETCG